ncbi:Abca1, partial [Symbiodinium microadriaticum]
PNGAGKSTLVGILSGILDATSGEQYIGGKSIKTERTGIHKLVGICPQFDVVWGELTVEQHLTFQAEQRGIPSRLVYAEVQRVAIAVGLDGDGFRTQAARLSGGMRRRLSIGMSIVGDPPILFLDEPTT